MSTYLPPDRLMQHIDQYLDGRSPGGNAGLAAFFAQHHVTVADVVRALQVTGRGDAATVEWHVAQHPELAEWYGAGNNSTPAAKEADT